MKIIDILMESAELVGMHKDAVNLTTATPENETEFLQNNETMSSMFNLIKFSIRELCTNYVPVSSSKTIVTSECMFPVSDLQNFIRVQNITKNNQLVKFKVINRNIVLEEDGEYVVNYATYPEISSMFEEIDFLQNFSPDAIIFGLCSYFALSHGMFDDFETFHDKYIEKAESLKNLKIFEMPARRWE